MLEFLIGCFVGHALGGSCGDHRAEYEAQQKERERFQQYLKSAQEDWERRMADALTPEGQLRAKLQKELDVAKADWLRRQTEAG